MTKHVPTDLVALCIVMLAGGSACRGILQVDDKRYEPGGAPCEDVADDPANCGACGHDCLGGDCVGSKCQPVVLYTGPETAYPTQLVLTANHVYWSDFGNDAPGSVWRIGKDGSSPTSLASMNGHISAIAVVGPYLFFGDFNNGTIWRTGLDGSNLQQIATVSGPRGFIAEPDWLYAAVGTPGPNQIVRVPIGGGDPVVLYDVGGPMFGGIAVDATSVYFSEAVAGGSVLGVAKEGSAPTPVVSSLDSPLGVLIDGADLYCHDDHALWRRRTDGSDDAEQLAAGPQAFGMTVDDASVYWTVPGFDTKDGAIFRIAKGGGAPELLAYGYDGAVSIVGDETALYWTSQRDRTINKLAK